VCCAMLQLLVPPPPTCKGRRRRGNTACVLRCSSCLSLRLLPARVDDDEGAPRVFCDAPAACPSASYPQRVDDDEGAPRVFCDTPLTTNRLLRARPRLGECSGGAIILVGYPRWLQPLLLLSLDEVGNGINPPPTPQGPFHSNADVVLRISRRHTTGPPPTGAVGGSAGRTSATESSRWGLRPRSGSTAARRSEGLLVGLHPKSRLDGVFDRTGLVVRQRGAVRVCWSDFIQRVVSMGSSTEPSW
jgi:hypothetical protein